MKVSIQSFFGLLIFLVLFGCNNNDLCDEPNSNCTNSCESLVEINPQIFNTLPPFSHTIDSISVDGNCLTVIVSDSGCDGSEWEIKLIDSGEVAESLPVQRFLRVTVDNPEFCTAIIQKEISFDLNPIRLVNEEEIILNIENYSEQILFK